MKNLHAIIVDDEKIISDSLAELLKQTKKFETVNNYYSLTNVKKEMLVKKYDYLFTDLVMPGYDVKEFIGYARKAWPKLIILVVSSLTDVVRAKELFDMGANGYLSKYSGSTELKTAIEKTAAGERYVSADMANKLANANTEADKKGITKRELEILRLVAQGRSIAETASILNLSEHTIVSHRRNIMEKLGIHSATEMVKYVYENKMF